MLRLSTRCTVASLCVRAKPYAVAVAVCASTDVHGLSRSVYEHSRARWLTSTAPLVHTPPPAALLTDTWYGSTRRLRQPPTLSTTDTWRPSLCVRAQPYTAAVTVCTSTGVSGASASVYEWSCTWRPTAAVSRRVLVLQQLFTREPPRQPPTPSASGALRPSVCVRERVGTGTAPLADRLTDAVSLTCKQGGGVTEGVYGSTRRQLLNNQRSTRLSGHRVRLCSYTE